MSENPGSRNRRFMLRRPDLEKRPDGARSGEFIDVAPVWAKVKSSSGAATVRAVATLAGNLDVPVRYTLRLAFRRGIERGWQAVEIATGDIYQVVLVSHDIAGREWTDLVCETGAQIP